MKIKDRWLLAERLALAQEAQSNLRKERDRLLAKVKDLKARLKAQTSQAEMWADVVSVRMGAYNISDTAKQSLEEIRTTADLRVKNWKKKAG